MGEMVCILFFSSAFLPAGYPPMLSQSKVSPAFRYKTLSRSHLEVNYSALHVSFLFLLNGVSISQHNHLWGWPSYKTFLCENYKLLLLWEENCHI